ncbi:MAG: hypothetical protein HKN07_07545 [Acidimicrobiia bacterium]|nr:hypothetical protein [Acidimicrobiia bacterium]NNF64099.1 hypothetical protein [Acidimicrobiia bacterium]
MGHSATNATAADQLDDQFRSLLEGLRTTLPGVQVLFAFLLTLPLLPAFDRLTTAERWGFAIAFFGSALASVLLIAPSVHQRVRAPISGIRRRDPSHIRAAVRLAISGTIAFIVALVAAVYLISSLIMPVPSLTVIATSAIAGVAGWAWFYMPLVQFRD